MFLYLSQKTDAAEYFELAKSYEKAIKVYLEDQNYRRPMEIRVQNQNSL